MLYLVKVEHKARQHVMAFLINFLILFLHIELSEEVEGNDSVDVHHNCQQQESQDELLAIVCDRLQDGPQCLEPECKAIKGLRIKYPRPVTDDNKNINQESSI